MPEVVRESFQGTSPRLLLPSYFQVRALSFRASVTLGRAWKLVRKPAFEGGRSEGRHPGPMICEGEVTWPLLSPEQEG